MQFLYLCWVTNNYILYTGYYQLNCNHRRFGWLLFVCKSRLIRGCWRSAVSRRVFTPSSWLWRTSRARRALTTSLSLCCLQNTKQKVTDMLKRSRRVPLCASSGCSTFRVCASAHSVHRSLLALSVQVWRWLLYRHHLRLWREATMCRPLRWRLLLRLWGTTICGERRYTSVSAAYACVFVGGVCDFYS